VTSERGSRAAVTSAKQVLVTFSYRAPDTLFSVFIHIPCICEGSHIVLLLLLMLPASASSLLKAADLMPYKYSYMRGAVSHHCCRLWSLCPLNSVRLLAANAYFGLLSSLLAERRLWTDNDGFKRSCLCMYVFNTRTRRNAFIQWRTQDFIWGGGINLTKF